MRICFCFFLLFGFCNAIGIDGIVELALKNSDEIKEQEFVLSERYYDVQAQESYLYPSLDFKYSLGGEASSLSVFSEASLDMSVNLFNGFRDKFNISSKQDLYKAQTYALRGAKDEIIYRAKTLYIQILKAKGTLEISQDSIRLLELQLQQAKQFYKQGISSKNNVLSIEVSLASAKLNSNRDKNNLNYLLSSLQKMTGTNVLVDELEDLDMKHDDIAYDELFMKMFNRNSLYLELLSKRDSILNEIDSSSGGFYPKVDFLASQKLSNNTPISQSYARLNFSMNLFGGFLDKSNVSQKRYRFLAIDAKIASMKKKMTLSLQKVLDELSLAKEQYSLSLKSLESAKENYRIVSNRYKQNLETSRELLNAEIMLTTAKVNVLNSQYDVGLSLVNIDYLINS